MIDPSERLAFIYRSNVSMTEAIDRIYNGLVNQRSPHNSLAADFTITRKIADIKREDVEKEGLFARKKIRYSNIFLNQFREEFDESLKILIFVVKCYEFSSKFLFLTL